MNLGKEIGQFFKKNPASFIENYQCFICRYDGILVYSNSVEEKSLDLNSICALLGGVWQASAGLAAFIKDAEAMKEFRLSFDSSSSGVFVLPLKINNTEYYFGTMYSKEMNPGQLKSKLRFYRDKIQNLDFSTKQKKDDRFLFNDISDDEMDNLFSFSGEA
ncbi:MAG: hypothetical protein H6622_02950 [Halobacteriovoraceae bacterium]|nr:hypothetical protein [Halobacteriovoraceae bacterium]